MEAKEGVLDRIEQTFELFKNNFKDFFIPIFLYGFLTSTLFSVVGTYLLVKRLEVFINNNSIDGLSFFELLYSPELYMYIIVGIFLLLLYLILYIPFLLGVIKSIKQAYNGKKCNGKENLGYGFMNLLNSFKTYWYIFAYVALIPAIIFIAGGILFIIGMESDQEILSKMGGGLMIVGGIIFIVFSVYRGLKATFGLYSAVDKDKYEKENFQHSLKITKEKWWRIFGNLVLVGFIGGLVVGMLQGFIDAFGSSFDIGTNLIVNDLEENSTEGLRNAAMGIIDSYSPISNFITNSLQQIIKTVFSIFIIVFTYILFKRLELESLNVEKDSKTQEL